jgi:RNA polymerase sigma factor (sigma-70 family)
MNNDQRVHLVDDDSSVRDAIRTLLEVSSIPVTTYESGESFLAKVDPSWSGCVLLDLKMVGCDGLHVQQELLRRSIGLPVVIMTAYGDVATVRLALKSGAHDFLEKPVDNTVLLDVVRGLLDLDQRRRRELEMRDEIDRRFARLTGREREVMDLLVAGRQHREIAQTLGISPRTVEVYKSRMMEKISARSLADVIHLGSRVKGPYD